MEIQFEWNEKKAATNLKKHKVSFEEAKSAFYDEKAIDFFDEENSTPGEDRFILLGVSGKVRILVTCYLLKDEGKKIRIISSRKATKSERQHYNQRVIE